MTDLQPVETTATDTTGAPLPAVSPPPVPVARTATLNEKLAYAEALAKADMLPTSYRRKPSNVLIAIEYAEMLGIAPVMALTHIHVVEGKPTMSAEMMRSKVLEAGHRFDILEHSSKAARVRITRCDGRAEPLTVEFTFEDARRAQLTNKNNWKHYPASMLLARVTSMAVRAVCPDATMGIGYVPEELGAEVDAEGNVISVPSSHTPDETEPEWPKDYLNETPLKDRAKSTLVLLLDGDKEKAKEIWAEHFTKLDTTDIRLGHLRMAIGTFEADGTAVPSLPDAAPVDEPAATPQTDEQVMAEAHEMAAAEQTRTESPSGASPAGIATPEQVAALARMVSDWTPEQKVELKAWVNKEMGKDLKPSSHTEESYARVLQHVTQVKAAVSRAQVRAGFDQPVQPTKNEIDAEFREWVFNKIAVLGGEYVETFKDLLEGLENNPMAGQPWERQVERLPAEFDEVLAQWTNDLMESHAEESGERPPPPDLSEHSDWIEPF